MEILILPEGVNDQTQLLKFIAKSRNVQLHAAIELLVRRSNLPPKKFKEHPIIIARVEKELVALALTKGTLISIHSRSFEKGYAVALKTP